VTTGSIAWFSHISRSAAGVPDSTPSDQAHMGPRLPAPPDQIRAGNPRSVLTTGPVTRFNRISRSAAGVADAAPPDHVRAGTPVNAVTTGSIAWFISSPMERKNGRGAP